MSRKQTKVIMFTLTKACNLNCVYCYERHKTDERLSFETAWSVIQQEMKSVAESEDFNELRIDFFGGEPFLAFDLIKEIVERMERETFQTPYYFFITTNGTKVTPDIQKWLLSKKNKIQVGLSYDGTPQMQDVNRSNSSSLIDLEFFIKNYPTQTIKTTVSRQTLSCYAEGVIYLHKLGARVNSSCASGDDWGEDEFEEYSRQLRLLHDFYCEHWEITPDDAFDVYFANMTLPRVNYQRCGANRSLFLYDVDGRRYPCHMFAPVVTGDDEAQQRAESLFQTSEKERDVVCNDCDVKNICSNCRGYNYSQTGSLNKYDERLCELFKRRCEAVASLKVARFQHKRASGGVFSRDELREMRGVAKYLSLVQQKGDR